MHKSAVNLKKILIPCLPIFNTMNIRSFGHMLSVGLLLFLSAPLTAQIQTNPNVDTLIKQVHARFAPDARDDYFHVRTLDDGRRLIETSAKEIPAYLESLSDKPSGLIVKLLPDTALKGKVQGVINLSVATMRTRSSYAAELATQATMGTPVEVLKKQGAFYLVRTPDGYLGWMDRYGVSLKDASEMQTWKATEKLIYIEDYGHVYTSPKMETRVSDVVLGDVFIAGKQQSGMQELIFPDGRKGFVPVGSVTDFDQWLKQAEPTADHIIATAKTLIGVPYLWGGTSIKGVDCSGFTKTAYFMNGLVLPRDASQQARAGIAVDAMQGADLDVQKALKNMKKGDLIFFSGSKFTNPKKPVTHVALYIGDGQFIHSAGRVRINSFDPQAQDYDSQCETIVAVRRFLGNQGAEALPTVDIYNPS